jgi:hypothetical protein
MYYVPAHGFGFINSKLARSIFFVFSFLVCNLHFRTFIS